VRDVGSGRVEVWRLSKEDGKAVARLTQVVTEPASGGKLVNGQPQGKGPGMSDLKPIGTVASLAGGAERTGPLGPAGYVAAVQGSQMLTWAKDTLTEAGGDRITIYYPLVRSGADLLTPGGSPTFKSVRNQWPADLLPADAADPAKAAAHAKARWDYFAGKLDFLSLMLALFCGTASLPHILIRYYTVKDQAAARKSTVVGIAAIGFFYILTLFLGLGAMTSGALDPTNNNMAAPLLARSFNEFMFACVSAIAFTTVLGTVSGLIMAASGAVAHDLFESVLGVRFNDHAKVRVAKLVSIAVGVVAMALGVVFEKMNVTFLVGWAFNIAASANLPALVMLLFWRGTTRHGISAAIAVGMVSSLAWVLLSGPTYKDIYGLDPTLAPMPFSQPGLVTIPLGFAVLVGVSLLTRPAASPSPRT
jgi:cation/acetate symporter